MLAGKHLQTSSDPCSRCSIGQDCCAHLKGLKLSGAEYERCFARHEERLTVTRIGPVFAVSVRGGGACPNWIGGRCSVYDVRPMECRLFPFSADLIELDARRVRLGVHSLTRCPAKRALLVPEETARGMVRDWAREAFAGLEVGPVSRETRFTRIARLPRRAVRKLRRVLGI